MQAVERQGIPFTVKSGEAITEEYPTPLIF